MRIDIISDTVCPWCLIGKRHLEAALAERPELTPATHWRPFQLHPDVPPEGVDRKTAVAAKFGSLEAAQETYQQIAEAGKAVGIEFNFDAITRTPNTINSHRLIYWAGQQGVQSRMAEILFRDFLINGLDIGDQDVLIAAAAEAGLDPDRVARKLAGDDDVSHILTEEAAARKGGVEGVPFFIFERKYALSGAQQPSVIVDVFDKLAAEGVLT